MIKIGYILLYITLSVSMTSCAIWDLINPFSKEGVSVDAELTVGDKEEAINTEVTGKKETTSNIGENINNTYQVINEQYPFWVIALLILGWVLPSPSVMGKAIIRFYRGKRI